MRLVVPWKKPGVENKPNPLASALWVLTIGIFYAYFEIRSDYWLVFFRLPAINGGIFSGRWCGNFYRLCWIFFSLALRICQQFFFSLHQFYHHPIDWVHSMCGCDRKFSRHMKISRDSSRKLHVFTAYSAYNFQCFLRKYLPIEMYLGFCECTYNITHWHWYCHCHCH